MRRVEKRHTKAKEIRRLRGPGTRFVWDPEPTRVFLDLWLEYIEEFRGPRKNTQIHSEMASRMRKFEVNPTEIKTKIDNMTSKYRSEMKKYRSTGQPSDWIYINEMSDILKDSKSVQLSLCMADNFDFSPFEDSDSNNSEYWKITEVEAKEVEAEEVEAKEVEAIKVEAKEVEAKEVEAKDVKPEEVEIKVKIEAEEMPTAINTEPERSTIQDNNIRTADRLWQLEKAKLDVRREGLKVMKHIADELSAVQRHFLKVYKFK